MSLLALVCFIVASVLAGIQLAADIRRGVFWVLLFLALGELFRELPVG